MAVWRYIVKCASRGSSTINRRASVTVHAVTHPTPTHLYSWGEGLKSLMSPSIINYNTVVTCWCGRTTSFSVLQIGLSKCKRKSLNTSHGFHAVYAGLTLSLPHKRHRQETMENWRRSLATYYQLDICMKYLITSYKQDLIPTVHRYITCTNVYGGTHLYTLWVCLFIYLHDLYILTQTNSYTSYNWFPL